jgi:hypothetical protein
MKIAIMQPYFVPYLGYFSLIKNTDKFILFDSVQFIRHGWIERNRILKPDLGWQYISVPLIKHKRETNINNILLNNSIDWKDKIFRQLEHYRKRAPFYKETIRVLENAFDIETDNITHLNANILRVICDYINIEIKLDIFSELNLILDQVNAPDEWALNICKALNDVSEYWNPEGGMSFFNPEKYENSGIKINFLKMNLPVYSQRRPEFEPGLSIIDVMMFNPPEKINEMLDKFELI